MRAGVRIGRVVLEVVDAVRDVAALVAAGDMDVLGRRADDRVAVRVLRAAACDFDDFGARDPDDMNVAGSLRRFGSG